MNSPDSFFSTIQNYVTAGLPHLLGKNRQSLWGRYFAICFKEVLQENKKFLSKLFDLNKNTGIILEYTYAEGRRADIALLDKDGQICALLEIKVDDSLHKGQLESYIKYCKKNKTKFFLITRWLPDQKERALIKTVGEIITLSDIYQTIESNRSPDKHPLSKMFCKFLKESKMDYEKKISNDLSFLAQKVFFSSKKDDRVSIDKLRDGVPESLSIIFTNLEIITRDLMERLNIKSRKLSLNMWFYPYCRGDKLNKLKENKIFDKDEDYNLKECKKLNMIDSGEIWFCSLINIGNSNSTFCAIEFGLGLEIDSNVKQPDLFFYWQINPDSNEVTYATKPISYSKKYKAWILPTKEDVIEIMEDGFRKAKIVYEKKYANTKLIEAKRIPYLRKVFRKGFP